MGSGGHGGFGPFVRRLGRVAVGILSDCPGMVMLGRRCIRVGKEVGQQGSMRERKRACMYLGERLVLIQRFDLRRGVGNQVPTLLQVASADKGFAASRDAARWRASWHEWEAITDRV